MFVILILHTLILHSGNNIAIPNSSWIVLECGYILNNKMDCDNTVRQFLQKSSTFVFDSHTV